MSMEVFFTPPTGTQVRVYGGSWKQNGRTVVVIGDATLSLTLPQVRQLASLLAQVADNPEGTLTVPRRTEVWDSEDPSC